MAAYLDIFSDVLWIYLGVPAIVGMGLYLTVRSRCMQVRRLPAVLRTFWELLRSEKSHETGVHPLKAFFASVGGCVGIGNIVVVCTAVQVGGPGALFWLWVTALIGVLLKFAEVYLGVRHRVANEQGGYDGGPAYYLQHAFRVRWLPKVACVLLCIYGVEILQFNIVTTSLTENFGWNKVGVIAVFLAMVLWAGVGGVRRVGRYCSAIIPVFTLLFVGMGLWVLVVNIGALPGVIKDVVSSAFTGHAAVGGFAGSGALVTISQGVRWGCYSGDIGVGYAAVLHSESCVQRCERQASMTIVEIILDTLVICTTSILLILVTDVWHQPISAMLLVQEALAGYFPGMKVFMPFFVVLLGYSTLIAYFAFGLKASKFLSPRWGQKVYFAYAIVVLTVFSFADTSYALAIMSITGGMLLLINVAGIAKLRHEITFDVV